MGAARIGRIRLKSGGAEVRVLRNPMPDAGGTENWRGRMIEHAKVIGAKSEPGSELVGFFVVGFFADGCNSMGIRWDDQRFPVPRSLMPAYIEELVRLNLLTEPRAESIACDVVNRANGWEPE